MASSGLPDIGRLIDVIGVPLDHGAATRGARLGPEALRAANLKAKIESLGYAVRDLGDVPVSLDSHDDSRERSVARHAEPVRETCLAVAEATERSLQAGAFPVVVGGDHSLAVGVLAGVARVNGPQGIIWFDAHADMNTPATSPTGNIHGMAMAAVLGDVGEVFPPAAFSLPAADAHRCVFIGLRDLDPGEKLALRERGLTCFTMSDIDRIGMAKVMERAIEIAARGAATIHVSLDIDALDPATAPGTGTPVAGGLTYREAHLAMEIVAETGCAHSIEVVEVNPTLDNGSETARLAVELICSALGKSIL